MGIVKRYMINLQKISGLPILFNEKNLELEFQGDFPFIKKSERSLEELRPYLKNPEAKNGPRSGLLCLALCPFKKR